LGWEETQCELNKCRLYSATFTGGQLSKTGAFIEKEDVDAEHENEAYCGRHSHCHHPDYLVGNLQGI
jgi:hypothetical protein